MKWILLLVLLFADASRPVVVDPLDLRKPVPDPEGALTEKYDGKLVRFTGVVRRASTDRKTKQPRYELHYAILGKKKGARKAEVVETVVVAVTFASGQKDLTGTVTVEGKGSVMVDGSLVISDATAVLVPRK
jgi:hypothetical protein